MRLNYEFNRSTFHPFLQVIFLKKSQGIYSYMSFWQEQIAPVLVIYAEPKYIDTKTGLMWAAQDNGRLLSWYTARSYCQNYNGGGHTDWRMPTLIELASLYDPGEKNKYGYHVTKCPLTS